jgi:PKD repeat protein
MEVDMKAHTVAIALLLAAVGAQCQTTYYVRPGGGTAEQCTGKADADYPGGGSGQPCAFSHPFQALPPGGTPRMAGGDTLIIAAGSYMMGYQASGAEGCASEYRWDCFMPAVPSGPDASHPTRILGAGFATGCTAKPELWGTERSSVVLNLNGTSNAEMACLEITDHSGCVEFHSGGLQCQRDTAPYGAWAATGLQANDSSNVHLADLDIHGMAYGGIRAGRLADWTLDSVRLAANGWVGWDGDIDGEDSNSGALTFRHFTVEWNGCAETYPGKQPAGCWAQSAGGYGDGLGTGATGGTWLFEDSSFLYNTSDGLDLLYARGSSSITIRRVHAEGNAGNQLKSNGPVTIENTIAVGNCGYHQGQPFTFNVDPCRAVGNTLSLTLREGAHAVVTNSTITGEGDVLVLSDCDTEHASCNGDERVVLRNNILIGHTEFLAPDDVSALTYQETYPQGDQVWDIDYSVIRGVKDDACPGSHHTCGQATGVVSEDIDGFDAHLLATSPAIDAGTGAGAPLVDFDNLPRDEHPDIGALEYRVNGACTVSCTTAVPATAALAQSLAFTGQAAAANCTSPLTYDWDFGDSSSHATTTSASHAYAAAGTYTWRFVASSGVTTCSRAGTITVSGTPPPAFQYILPAIAHSRGAAGTDWRSDIAVVNASASPATLSLAYVDAASGKVTMRTRTLAASATEEWRDVLVGIFGVAPAATASSGAVRLGSNQPLAVSARTYNQETSARTFGQSYPALTAADGLATGQMGLLPGLKGNAAFRTNIGFANLGSAACTVSYSLRDGTGARIGSSRAVSVPAAAWKQDNDVFTRSGAGSREIAYAEVAVDTASCRIWAYASLIDNSTGDPTTIGVIVPATR